jgi:ubiquinone/menaquinone biosynthesis C-methylase UbiE
MNLPFDRAVPYYDQTRSEPDWVMRRVADSFVRETQATRQSKILEVGIGTGRIAMPLLERGLEIVGADLSLPMMAQLRKKAVNGDLNFALVQSEAAILPFCDESFDVVYAVHVYHLVPRWQMALQEARRVLKQGGRYLVSFHYRDVDSPNRKIRQKLGAMARERGFDVSRPGAKSDQELSDELRKWDGNLRVVEVAHWKTAVVPAQVLEHVRARIHSDAWLLPPEVHEELTPYLEEWARDEFKDLQRPIEIEEEFNWLIATKQ